ncbi:MAG: metal ABC transporter substrate-binding protein [Nocardioides sp.]|nr:metal ABC transporter substrate-binding protein [Nocardioides sp.]
MKRLTRRLTRRLPVLVALLLFGSGCAAFSDDTASDPAGDDELSVTAAFYPLQYVAQRVTGDLAEVANLTQPGGEPHDLTLSVAETAELAGSDLVVYEADFQPAVDAAVEQNAGGDVLDVSGAVDLMPVSEDAEAQDTEEGGLDPHFWQDPSRMAALGDAVADRLSDLDPDHAETYAANAATLRGDLEALDTEFTDTLATCARTTIVVSHDAFGYLGRYGLEIEPIAGLSPDAEPTPADLGRLQQVIDDDGITTVFSERLVSPALSESLAQDKGITTAILDPIEGLSDETADQDYLSLMRANLAALEEANGCA